jgi:hypothetical protein
MRMIFTVSYEPRPNAVLSDCRPENVLISYAFAKHFARVRYTPPYLMLDSGAFTAWQAGKPTDLHGYARFAQALLAARRDLPTWAVNLDVIPGEYGRSSSAEERRRGMAQSLRNADTLRAYGLPVVEVFHQDEPWEFLDTLIARLPRRAVLGISPRNDVSATQRARWLAELLRHLRETRRIAAADLPRCHGLAATCRECLEAFPFYSADSSTWANAYRFGNVVQASGRQARVTKALFPSSTVDPAQHLTTRRNITNLQSLGSWATELWRARGVSFAD